jgi:hypothetical protein
LKYISWRKKGSDNNIKNMINSIISFIFYSEILSNSDTYIIIDDSTFTMDDNFKIIV